MRQSSTVSGTRGARNYLRSTIGVLLMVPALLLGACASEPEPVPPPPVVAAPPPAVPVALNYVVLFDFDSSRLNAAGQIVVNQVAAAAAAGQGASIQLVGHTDTVGSPAYNLRLSQARVATVQNALVSGGVAAARIVSEARGETDLAVPTGDGVRNQANRRVVITAN